jgi:glycine/D-amino acid oxidase-like deaminating enzyme
VVTEKGTIRTPLAIMAGGAWASSFCRQLDVRFPQAAVRQSIVALATGGIDLPDAFYSKSFSITRRGEGCHSLAISGRASVDDAVPPFLPRVRPDVPAPLAELVAGRTGRLPVGP